jgi:hypothetical protein
MLLLHGNNDLIQSAYLLWLIVAYVAYIAMGALPSDKQPFRKPPLRVLADRLIFFLVLFALPLLVFTLAGWEMPGRASLGLGRPASWLPASLLISLLAFAIGYYAKKGPAERANYPQYSPPRWGAGELALELASWSLYLYAYEFVFRGFLLYALLPLGVGLAIVTQTGLYAFAHLPKSAKEAGAAVIFGLATALMTLVWDSIAPAFIVHLALALANDLSCFRAMKRA